jgi:MoaA/NifB/PqqE/SkfB family radical SAM enzyme
MERVLDAVIELRPRALVFTGGEPLLVKGITAMARRAAGSGITVSVYTGGWTIRAEQVDDLLASFDRICVSLDGASAATHDAIRGRRGSFDRALNALALLDSAAGRRRAEGLPTAAFGIDCVAVRSNLAEIDALCTDIAARFGQLEFVNISAAMPAGLASRTGFQQRELLSDADVEVLEGEQTARRLQDLAPDGVQAVVSRHHSLIMRPDLIEQGIFMRGLQVEPDGAVRALAIYEGTVGNLLDEPGDVLWKRAVERWSDPFVVETLATATTMSTWADAARAIDYHFASEQDRARIDLRPAFTGLTG